MLKSLTAVFVSLALAASVMAAQVGDVVEQKFSTNVVIQNNVAKELTHVNLDKGVWSVTGQADFFGTQNGGITFAGAAITAGSPVLDATGGTVFTSSTTKDIFSIMGLTVAPRVFEISVDGTPVYLVGYNLGFPSQTNFSFGGFINAQKIKNN